MVVRAQFNDLQLDLQRFQNVQRPFQIPVLDRYNFIHRDPLPPRQLPNIGGAVVPNHNQPAPRRLIRWEIADPADGDNAAETHCAICMDPDDSKPILGHPIVRNDGQIERDLTHRVHKACLLAFDRAVCPQCEIPYQRNQIPSTLSERLIEKGKIIGMEALQNYGIYCAGAILFSLIPCGDEFIMGLIKGPSLYFPFSGIFIGSVMGAASSSLISGYIGDTVYHLGIDLIEQIAPQNIAFRRALIITTIALSILTSSLIAGWAIKTLANRTISPLSPKALAVYNSYMNSALNIEKYPIAALKAGIIAYKRIYGSILSCAVSLSISSICKVIKAVEREEREERELMDWINHLI